MNEEQRLEEQKFSEHRKIMVYTEIVRLCGSCVGRIDDPRVEKALCNTARLLSCILADTFLVKEQQAFEKAVEDFPRRRKRRTKNPDEALSGDDK